MSFLNSIRNNQRPSVPPATPFQTPPASDDKTETPSTTQNNPNNIVTLDPPVSSNPSFQRVTSSNSSQRRENDQTAQPANNIGSNRSDQIILSKIIPKIIPHIIPRPPKPPTPTPSPTTGGASNSFASSGRLRQQRQQMAEEEEMMENAKENNENLIQTNQHVKGLGDYQAIV